MSDTVEGGPDRQWLWSLCLGLFALTLVLSINAVKIGIGPLPLRSLTFLGCGLAVALADIRVLGAAFQETRRVLLVIALAALLGLVASILAEAPIALVIRQLLEIHVQAAVGIVVAYGIVLRYGPGPVLVCFLGAYGISALFAVAQVVGINFAWEARAMIGALSNDTALTKIAYVTRYRALGLSFSPVLFATQTCLAIVAFFCLRLVSRRSKATRLDWTMLGACAFFGLLCVATGNRSPLLGIVIFIAVYCAAYAPKLVLAALPVLLLLGVGAQSIMTSLDGAGVRVASSDDGSAEGRGTLRRYGIFLVERRPIGYGLTFDSTAHWQDFAHRGRYLPNPLATRQWALHNYYLSTLVKYGVFVIGLLVLIFPTRLISLLLWLPFLPYMVHIYFHNDGPLQSDFLIFYLLAAVVWLSRHPSKWLHASESDLTERVVRPWHRAFVRQAV